MYQDEFGFLPSYSTYKDGIRTGSGIVIADLYKTDSKNIEIEIGTIERLPNYSEIEKQIKQEQHKDGFFYPPIVKSYNVEPFSGETLGEIPNTKRPAHLYKLPMSHTIQLNVSGNKEDIRHGIGGLIVYLLSYLLGTRLQFEDWWLDGRIPMKSTHHIVFSHAVMEEFISHACRTWQNWPETGKHLFLNILYMNSRVPSYQWFWEQFMISFMVFDACYKLSTELGKITRQGSRGGMESKLKSMCKTYGLFFDNKKIKVIANLRNQLFHEALCDNLPPGMGGEAVEEAYNLKRLNQRLIPALLGYQTNYVHTSWASISRMQF